MSAHNADMAPNQRHGGMTLVELLVSVAVLAVILLAFGAILSATQKVTVRSNLLMQGNSAASAIAQIIRDDVSALTKDGFLAIAYGTESDYLVFTAVGTYTSKVNSTITANAARVAYGRNDASNANPNDGNVLWRRVTLLTPGITATDCENTYLGQYLNWNTPPDVQTNGVFVLKPPNVVIPPTNPTQIAALYPVLAPACLSFRVQWLDTAGVWHSPVAGTPYVRNWSNVTTPPSWPTAIKVTFSLQASEKAEDTLDYEVICPIRQ